MSTTLADSTPNGAESVDLVVDNQMTRVFVEIPVDSEAKAQGKKGPGRPRKIKADSEGAEGDALAVPSTPKTPAKRGRQAKAKTPQTTVDGTEVPPSAPKSSVKRGAAEVGNNETPSKKPKATPKTPAAAKVGFPTCWEEFANEDKMIVNMRRDKVAWPEIEAEWEKMTGSKPGKDVLRKKYAKLEAVATIFAPGDTARLVAAKLAVETQIEESIKQLRLTKWAKVAERMKEDGAGVYKAAAVEKKFDHMVKNNEIDGEGKYIGTDKVVTNGDTVMEHAEIESGGDELADADANADADAEDDA